MLFVFILALLAIGYVVGVITSVSAIYIYREKFDAMIDRLFPDIETDPAAATPGEAENLL